MLLRTQSKIIVEEFTIYSQQLQRQVLVDCYMPRKIYDATKLPLLLVNDGQDLRKFHFLDMLQQMTARQEIEEMVVIGIHCGDDRINEYGTAAISDYKSRGNKAKAHTNFVFDELLPYIRKRYNLPNVREKAFAGFSLGALSALDIVWNRAREFDKVGCFSGSFWWRTKAIADNEYTDDLDRIMHQQIRAGEYKYWLQFYFQCGTEDETEDRNNNGVIDSIDDTKELIFELVKKGYKYPGNITYDEIVGGKHDVHTWGQAMPTFLKWGWGYKK